MILLKITFTYIGGLSFEVHVAFMGPLEPLVYLLSCDMVFPTQKLHIAWSIPVSFVCPITGM